MEQTLPTRQEADKPTLHPIQFLWAELTFPYDKDTPAKVSQQSPMARIAKLGLFQLWSPIIPTGRRHSVATIAGVLVPEATVNKNDLPPSGEYDIWTTRQASVVQNITITISVQVPAND